MTGHTHSTMVTNLTSRWKKTVRNGLTAISAGLFGAGITGCDDVTGTDSDPLVLIETIMPVGILQNNIEIKGRAEDDKGLEYLRISIDGEEIETRTLTGLVKHFNVTTAAYSPGTHLVELEVGDNSDNIGHTSGQVTIPEPIVVYDANIFMMREDRIEPATGVEFCLSNNLCTTTDQNGKALFTDIPIQPGYELQFIEGAHPQYLVALRENRLVSVPK